IGNYLYIGTENLKIPYWFMNSQDFINLFKASEKSQAPVLNDAFLYARNKQRRETVDNINEVLEDAKKYFNALRDKYPDRDPEQTYKYIKEEKRIEEKIKEFIMGREDSSTESPEVNLPIDADSPHYFELEKFIPEYLEDAMRVESKIDKRVKEYCSLMILRIERYFKDPRFKFLFDTFPEHPNSLALFLRFILGRMEKASFSEEDDFVNNEKLYFKKYLEEYKNKQNHQIVIIDLSLLASEILENITALIGRLIIEFLQRVAKENKDLRGKFPVVLVLEEAHNYIPEKTKGDRESVSKIIFERIAREGRKFGLSLVISSQRPSELSRTVLSQCNSFIIHRIQNPEDQQYIKSIVPSVNQDLLEQLPILAQQTALTFGDCVRSPALVKIREANPLPQSDDPKFFRHWIGEVGPEEPPFEDVCSKWEGGESET
ncbi:MAG: ATPase, partial [Candidatus Omnitrophota bacterium]